MQTNTLQKLCYSSSSQIMQVQFNVATLKLKAHRLCLLFVFTATFDLGFVQKNLMPHLP